MKRVLITGKNSYVGTNVEKWLMKEPDKYYVESISVRGEEWKNFDFSKFDVVFHVAGIAHVSSKKNMKELYFKVNKNLTVEIANKAKKSGIKQFIFMSSIIVYGKVENNGMINLNTLPSPSNFYGESKLQAEKSINSLIDDTFKVVILRPPMIYGKDSKGNYQKLSKLIKKIRFFPNYKNRRSILYIKNLAEFVKLIIIYESNGIFFPQNKDYSSTSEIAISIAQVNNKRLFLTKFFNPFIALMKSTNLISKIFGNLTYDFNMSNHFGYDYSIKSFKESIKETEEKKKVSI